jgi:hypothetical protein
MIARLGLDLDLDLLDWLSFFLCLEKTGTIKKLMISLFCKIIHLTGSALLVNFFTGTVMFY